MLVRGNGAKRKSGRGKKKEEEFNSARKRRNSKLGDESGCRCIVLWETLSLTLKLHPRPFEHSKGQSLAPDLPAQRWNQAHYSIRTVSHDHVLSVTYIHPHEQIKPCLILLWFIQSARSTFEKEVITEWRWKVANLAASAAAAALVVLQVIKKKRSKSS